MLYVLLVKRTLCMPCYPSTRKNRVVHVVENPCRALFRKYTAFTTTADSFCFTSHLLRHVMASMGCYKSLTSCTYSAPGLWLTPICRTIESTIGDAAKGKDAGKQLSKVLGM